MYPVRVYPGPPQDWMLIINYRDGNQEMADGTHTYQGILQLRKKYKIEDKKKEIATFIATDGSRSVYFHRDGQVYMKC